MRWLYKLEYKHGNRYIPNLMMIIVMGMGAVYLLDMFFAPGGISLSSYLSLNTAAIMRGEVWRLITFIFVYPSTSTFWLLIQLYFYYIIGRNLESAWGGFKFNIYYLFGIVGTIVGTFAAYFLIYAITGLPIGLSGSNMYLNLSLFLAFASIMPDTQFLLFFVIPVKAKWLIIFYAVMLLVPLLQTFMFQGFISGLASLILLAFSLINYFIFFGSSTINSIKEQIRISRNRRNWKNNWRQ